jgi:hypothetical protein
LERGATRKRATSKSSISRGANCKEEERGANIKRDSV